MDGWIPFFLPFVHYQVVKKIAMHYIYKVKIGYRWGLFLHRANNLII